MRKMVVQEAVGVIFKELSAARGSLSLAVSLLESSEQNRKDFFSECRGVSRVLDEIKSFADKIQAMKNENK